MPHDLPKAYDPGAIEARWAEYWVGEQLFHVETPGPVSNPEQAPHIFTLLLPPPNVTGRLHMGHMLNHTEMDIITRWRRMRGALALWLPGTDHAGIATQMMVERQLASEGVARRELGREKFVERVWKWKAEYGGAILEQMKRLGDSVDWSREYFTMDDRLSPAVREAFVRLWEDGLIYRGKYIVNWCPRCQTAISDLEVVHDEVVGKIYEIRYPVEPSFPHVSADEAGVNTGHAHESGEFITVATTRPETMLGDTAVAVNAADNRYRRLHGRRVRLPLAADVRKDALGNEVTRSIPIILDELANPEFGTGAVKVTPAHDPNDFQAGLRHNLPQVDVMDEVARMNANAGRYAGLDRYEAREKIVNELREAGLLAAVRDHMHALGKCDRCKTVVEPRLSTQWFVAVNKQPKSGGPSMAERARRVVEDGSIRFTPENYKAIYLNWMAGIYDWCISRQLWWGHRIPAWHCGECAEIIVAREAPKSCAKCGSAKLTQDTDVMDTWFSSGLLPFTAFGWPAKTRDLEAFYPTSLLVTGFDILFFWVARMIMLGCHFMRDHRQDAAVKVASGAARGPREAEKTNDTAPFREVYIHALVRDAERQKMSKTKGNVVDPIEIIERFGTDAVRFTLASMAAPGTDIAFSESRTEGYRAFANKIWNAARFLFMHVDKAEESGAWELAEFGASSSEASRNVAGIPGFQPVTLEDRWIASCFSRAAEQCNAALAEYRFHEAALGVYHFFWDEFCDWYIELAKLRLNTGTDDAAKQATRAALNNLASLFEAALRLLAPFMPFLTEEIWHALYDGKPPLKSIALASFPQADAKQIDDAAETEMAVLIDLIVAVRNLRTEQKVETRAKVPVRVFADTTTRKLVEANRQALEKLANVEAVEFVSQPLSQQAGSRSTARFDVALVYEKKIDAGAERERLTKELAKLEGEALRAAAQLANDGFLAKAPPKVVEGLRTRAAELAVLIEKARRALDAIG
ncbi:MAG TPA: valine--tRNA ligase [Terriglobales bacterium]|nr:valine--tRNA ligase [Terriglobales bacterium]